MRRLISIPVRVEGIQVWACDSCAEELLSARERRRALALAAEMAQSRAAA